MNKFQVGEVVRIVNEKDLIKLGYNELEHKKYFPPIKGYYYIDDEMLGLFGKEVTISKVTTLGNCYEILEDGNQFNWEEGLFMKTNKKITKYSIGDRVLVQSFDYIKRNYNYNNGFYQTKNFMITPTMIEYCGTIQTIKDIISVSLDIEGNEEFRYILESPTGDWRWREDLLLPDPIKIIHSHCEKCIMCCDDCELLIYKSNF